MTVLGLIYVCYVHRLHSFMPCCYTASTSSRASLTAFLGSSCTLQPVSSARELSFPLPSGGMPPAGKPFRLQSYIILNTRIVAKHISCSLCVVKINGGDNAVNPDAVLAGICTRCILAEQASAAFTF